MQMRIPKTAKIIIVSTEVNCLMRNMNIIILRRYASLSFLV